MDILIFDNDVNFGVVLKERIDNILVKEKFDNDIVILYRNAEALLKEIDKDNRVKIFFIGINLKYNISKNVCDGLWIAQQIRKIDYISPIVFLSNHLEMSFNLFIYRLEAMDFILKSDMDIAEGRIKACIKTAHERYILKNDYREEFFSLNSEFTLSRIPFSEIIYFETSTSQHKIKLITFKQNFEFYKTLKEISELHKNFIRIHKSFVINKKNISSLDLKEKNIKMINGDICPISNKYSNIIKNYILEEGTSI
ncbi:LytTR family transcriptional regulator [Clostridioides difficile]|nr:LytTR family transcriptional regulator [Clostridioides difficile]